MESNSLNSKHFKFNNEADFILYLAELITDLIQKKDRLERYGNEVKLILKNNPNAKFIQSDIFESINDKVNRINQYIFNIIGDESKKAVSYRKFRKILFKQKNNLKITLNNLPREEVELIGEFNQLRNWGLHIPESLYVQKKHSSKWILNSFSLIKKQFHFQHMIILKSNFYQKWEEKFKRF